MKKSKHHKDCLVHTQTFLGRGLYLGFDKYHACPCKDLNAAKKLLKGFNRAYRGLESQAEEASERVHAADKVFVEYAARGLLEYTECETCAAKPGSPTLCAGCLNNRTHIGRLEAALRDAFNALGGER